MFQMKNVLSISYQACQGQATDSGSTVEGRRRRHTSTDATPAYKIPNYADFLIFQVFAAFPFFYLPLFRNFYQDCHPVMLTIP